MFTRALMLIALVLFVVFHVLKLTGHFNYEWVFVFSPLMYAYAIHLAANIKV